MLTQRHVTHTTAWHNTLHTEKWKECSVEWRGWGHALRTDTQFPELGRIIRCSDC
jgi:hypothetical protein